MRSFIQIIFLKVSDVLDLFWCNASSLGGVATRRERGREGKEERAQLAPRRAVHYSHFLSGPRRPSLLELKLTLLLFLSLSSQSNGTRHYQLLSPKHVCEHVAFSPTPSSSTNSSPPAIHHSLFIAHLMNLLLHSLSFQNRARPTLNSFEPPVDLRSSLLLCFRLCSPRA